MPATEDLVNRLEKEIPGYNQRPLDRDDLERLCDQAGAVLIFHPLPGSGMIFRRLGVPVIAVNERLSKPHAVYVGFHEFFHLRFHPGSVRAYAGSPLWLGKIELQASILASLAVLPTPILTQTLDRGENPAEIFGLPPEILELRLKAHRHYQDLILERRGNGTQAKKRSRP